MLDLETRGLNIPSILAYKISGDIVENMNDHLKAIFWPRTLPTSKSVGLSVVTDATIEFVVGNDYFLRKSHSLNSLVHFMNIFKVYTPMRFTGFTSLGIVLCL